MSERRDHHFGLNVLKIHIGHLFLRKTELHCPENLKDQRRYGEHTEEAYIPVIVQRGVQKATCKKEQNVECSCHANHPFGGPDPL